MFVKNRKMVKVTYIKTCGSIVKGTKTSMFESTAKALAVSGTIESDELEYSETEKEFLKSLKK